MEMDTDTDTDEDEDAWIRKRHVAPTCRTHRGQAIAYAPENLRYPAQPEELVDWIAN